MIQLTPNSPHALQPSRAWWPFTRSRELESQLGLLADRAVRLEAQLKELDLRRKVIESEWSFWRNVLTAMPDPVLVTDSFDEVLLLNEPFQRLFGLTQEGVLRKPVDQAIPNAALVKAITGARATHTRGVRRLDLEVEVGGVTRMFRVGVTPIMSLPGGTSEGPTEECRGVIVTLHDLTAEREVAASKNDFVSSVSHELRTPLASIKAYVEMLIDGEAADDKTRRDFYDVISGEANRLSRLIDNILNISRIESGLVRVDLKPVNLDLIIRDALDVIVPQARQREIEVITQLSPAVHQIAADRDMIYQAVLNLLGNAVKYSPPGATITVSTAVDEAAGEVSATVADTGPGIPEKDLPHIFDKFFRSKANNQIAKGTGLGLAMVKHVVQAVHHGSITVESKVGQGSRFTFRLPVLK